MKRSAKPAKKETTQRDTLDQAARALSAGKLDAALELYQGLYDQNPQDWTVANALGDLHVRMKHNDEAIEVFMSLAEHMAEQGHAVKARALYRKVLRVRPGDAAATARVAELENEHLDASPFMQRVRGVLLDAQAAAPQSDARPQIDLPEAAPEPLRPAVPEVIKLATLPPSLAPTLAPAPEPEPVVAYQAYETYEPPPAPALVPVTEFSLNLDLDPRPAQHSSISLEQIDGLEPMTEAFTPTSDAWLTAGLSLAAAPLVDHPAGIDTAGRLGAFQRMEAVARRAAASHDFRAAVAAVEQFLHAHPNDVDALEMLVEFGVDGRLESTPASQRRLADACVATGRMSSARHIALDMLNRAPTDPLVVELIDRIAAFRRDAQAHAAQTDALAPDVELFDDDGLVTDEGRARPAASQRSASTLDTWLDAADESDAREAVSIATRLTASGNILAAVATLEPLMKTPGLRPIIGMQLAQLYRRGGDYARALHCLEQALEQPPVNADNAHALAYELALTLEVMGQRNEALGLYRELLSEVGPAFRDVAARAEQLSAA